MIFSVVLHGFTAPKVSFYGRILHASAHARIGGAHARITDCHAAPPARGAASVGDRGLPVPGVVQVCKTLEYVSSLNKFRVKISWDISIWIWKRYCIGWKCHQRSGKNKNLCREVHVGDLRILIQGVVRQFSYSEICFLSEIK